MTLVARYHGECGDCGLPILPGDEITEDGDGGWAHAACVERGPAEVCPSCRMTRPCWCAQ